MISGRFLINSHVSGINCCCIYKQVSFSISWTSAFLSAVKKTTHAANICPQAKLSKRFFFFPNTVGCILIFLFDKSETLCEEWLWQRCLTPWAGTAPNLPGSLTGELCSPCSLPGTLCQQERFSFSIFLTWPFRWGGQGHFRLFPYFI